MEGPLLTRPPSGIDEWLGCADTALRTIAGAWSASRPYPGDGAAGPDEAQRRLSGALMRVNHVGEVCAQALYSAQGLVTDDPALKHHFQRAAREEGDHLAWTRRRLSELGDRPSLLNPLWYAGAFGIGLVAGRFGEAVSLGFLAETETQVEAHLQSHLDRLPAADASSRRIVEQMKLDEAHHAAEARRLGAAELPPLIKSAMRLAARVMTRTAHHV